MIRQKKYSEFFETLKQGARIYVYFPVKRVGLFSKLTSFWRSPFNFIEQINMHLYKVDCGR